MHKDFEEAYIPSCNVCQGNKSSTKPLASPLHPLPIPDAFGDSVTIDFVGPLPEDSGYNYLVTMMDRLNLGIQLVPTHTSLTAQKLADLFFDHWYCENSLPWEIVSDRDKLFLSQFWRALHARNGIKLKMSMAYHPKSNGSSERTNKMVVQALWFHVAQNQKGWVWALPRVCFDIMNNINVFHASELKPYSNNDASLFPSRQLSQPGPVITTDGAKEWLVDVIIDEHCKGHSV